MRTGFSANPGLLAYAALSLAAISVACFFATHAPPRTTRESPSQSDERDGPSRGAISDGPRASVPTLVASTHALAEGPRAAALLAARLAALLQQDALGIDEDEVSRVETGLIALGELAAPPLIEQIETERVAHRRDRMLDLLRRLPGRAAEDRLVDEARAGLTQSSRSLAIDALAERHTDRAISALAGIARDDPELPKHPLITTPRDRSDTSVELPDEVAFTPRMQAMAALTSTRHPQAPLLLMSVLQGGPDESLRMEAARHLHAWVDDGGTAAALTEAAAADSSPYVRLAALHSLTGSTDPTLAPVLERISTRDSDAGVRILASQLLAALRR